MNDDPIIIIPSREGSTRLHQKPLIDLNGKSLVQRVFELALKVTNKTYIATDSILIKSHVKEFTSNVIMTSDTHISGTDRVYEAATKLNLSPDQFIINLQGDEPFIPSSILKDIVNNYFTHSPDVITASQPLKPEDIDNPNCVKVLSNDKSQAIKFFRNNEDHHNNIDHHIGIYGYSYKTLNEFVNLKPSINELELKLEQLRFLDNDYKIYVSKFYDHIQKGIDTDDDVTKARNFLELNED